MGSVEGVPAVCGRHASSGLLYDGQLVTGDIAGFEGINRAWVEDLARSFVGDFDSSRIGVIVEVSKLSTWEMVRELYRVGIPLWYCWGELESKLERCGIQFLDEMAPPTMSEVEIESYYTRP
ncbi:hypothetical protein M422DRAFT_267718 [Sphaerobolus stellatus SS14]|uniref:Uncharacterized protein n=1 Tax=Sphaerobolus stellatus (strain SS14) TaxID=990650 RepID=A0A0C9UP37_SPHS4|nr:hypothetical protein M422DRAFT_267718 [Sphaerobolus stellatus SS14]